jgi:hypothetical protein
MRNISSKIVLTLDCRPDIDYADPRHTCALRATPQTGGTKLSRRPLFTTPREMCIMTASITVSYKDS